MAPQGIFKPKVLEEAPLSITTARGPGKYVAAWPVFVVGDDPPGLSFQIAVYKPTK